MRIYFILLFTFLLTACGPQYKTFTTYHPPTGPQEKDCVMQCRSMKMECESKCMEDYRYCMRESRLDAKEDYFDALHDYRREMDRWDEQMVRCRRRKNQDDCDYLESTRPKKPVREDFTHSYLCSDDCSFCTEDYDECFEMCGGKITRESRCVSGCD